MDEQINLLEAVKSTMNTIPVMGADAMDKFVGCYNAINTVISKLKEIEAEEGRKQNE